MKSHNSKVQYRKLILAWLNEKKYFVAMILLILVCSAIVLLIMSSENANSDSKPIEDVDKRSMVVESSDKQYYTVSNWTPQTVDNYFSSCVKRAQETSNYSVETISNYCGCTADSFQEIYKTDAAFAIFEKNIVRNGLTDEGITILQNCAKTADITIDL